MKFRYFAHRVSTLRFELKLLFIISLASILIIDLWLINKPEVFNGAAALGGIYYKICLAYLTALVFYFLNVHLASERTKVKTYKYINNKSIQINRLCETLISSLRDSYNKPIDADIDNEINTICKYINPQHPFILGGRYNIVFEHWFEAVNFVSNANKELTRDLLIIRDSVHPDIIEILTNIDDCIENFINLSHGRKIGNKNLEVYDMGIILYKKYSDELITTLHEKYKYHIIESSENHRKKHRNN